MPDTTRPRASAHRLRVLRGGLLLAAVLLALGLRPAAGRNLNLETLPVGYVFTTEEIVSSLGASSLRMGIANQSPSSLRLPAFETTLRRREDPAWLLLSNSPEILDEITLPKKRALLVSAEVPAGKGRILVSHANLHPLRQDLVLRMRNTSGLPAEVVLEPRAEARQTVIPASFRMDASVGALLAESYLASLQAPPQLGWQPADGDRKRIIRDRETSDATLVSGLRGLGMAWVSLTTTTPLHLAIYATPDGYAPDPASPIATRTGSQARGLFQTPDTDVEATVDLTDGRPHRYVFGEAERNNPMGMLEGGSWMSGTDATDAAHEQPQTNRGDFGGITWFHGTVKASPESGCLGALFLVVAGGRKAAVTNPKTGKSILLSQWTGLVVGRALLGQTWDYRFTLAPNSWAPVYLVAVPLHTR